MSATSISVSHETRKLLEALKTGGETYDDVIRVLIVSHPNRLTVAELARRVRERQRHPIEHLIAKSRRQSY
jgi:predicted CopG family antitoxin